MTPEEKRLIHQSFGLILPIADDFSEIFYGHLFVKSPFLKPLFRGSMKDQGQRLMQTLDRIVQGLDCPDTIRLELKALGARHAAYGVHPQDYDCVWQALDWAFTATLRAHYTSTVQAAWRNTYAWISRIMQEPPSQGVNSCA